MRLLGAARVQEFLRLYLVPEMLRCRGGAGASDFGQAFASDPAVEDARHDVLTAMVAWVEQQPAPEMLIGAHVEDGSVRFTRSLGPYPQAARYRGGNVNDTSSFRCQ